MLYSTPVLYKLLSSRTVAPTAAGAARATAYTGAQTRLVNDSFTSLVCAPVSSVYTLYKTLARTAGKYRYERFTSKRFLT